MRNTSAIVKQCGLKSVLQVAYLNGVSAKTIHRADKRRLKIFILAALDEQHKSELENAKRVIEGY